MDHIDPAVDEPVGKADLVVGHVVPPVGTPVDGRDDNVTGLPYRPGPGDEVIGGGAGQAGQESDPRPRGGRGPVRRESAGGGPRGDDHYPGAAGDPSGRGPAGLGGVTAGLGG